MVELWLKGEDDRMSGNLNLNAWGPRTWSSEGSLTCGELLLVFEGTLNRPGGVVELCSKGEDDRMSGSVNLNAWGPRTQAESELLTFSRLVSTR